MLGMLFTQVRAIMQEESFNASSGRRTSGSGTLSRASHGAEPSRAPAWVDRQSATGSGMQLETAAPMHSVEVFLLANILHTCCRSFQAADLFASTLRLTA